MSQELPGPRSLEDAKAWMLDKLAARVHPMGLTDVSTSREVIADLRGLDGQNWASAWMARGDHYAAEAAAAQNRGATALARDAWYQAYAFYFVGRFPCPNHPEKQRSYDKALAAYRAFGELATPPIEFVSVQFQGRPGEGQSIPFYVRQPEGIERPPVIVMWGGVDAWKEEMTILTEGITRQALRPLPWTMSEPDSRPSRPVLMASGSFFPYSTGSNKALVSTLAGSPLSGAPSADTGRPSWPTSTQSGSVPRSTGVAACTTCSSPIGSRSPATLTVI